MLEIDNWEVHNLERSLLASKNSFSIGKINTMPIDEDLGPTVGDLERGERLGSTPMGSGHDGFLSGILVTFDIKYPEYWSPEFQRYHWAQIIMSQSKMHKLTSMGKDYENFKLMFNEYVDISIIDRIHELITIYNNLPEEIIAATKHKYFMKIISNLPMGFEKWMTVTTNYLQLKTIYNQRKNHKLKEWHVFCDWCLKLPYFKDFVGV